MATKVPGVVVGIWIPGEGSYVAAKGFADPRSKQAMRSSYYFRIGSITKTFTATALLMLADEKKIGLDDPVSKYVDFVPNGDKITLRMLANMTSGLYNYTEDEAWVKTAFTNATACGRRASSSTSALRTSPTSSPAPDGITATPTTCCSA